MEPTQEDFNEKDLLITRAKEYFRSMKEGGEEERTQKTNRYLKSRRPHVKCRFHNENDPSNTWNDENAKCDLCIQYSHRETLPNGVLPRVKHVLEWLLTMRQLNAGKQINWIHVLAKDITMHWIYCNVYCTDRRSIEGRIKTLDQKLKQLFKYNRSKKTDQYWTLVADFLAKQDELFDIVADADRKSVQEKVWNVKFDKDFYENQKKNPPYSSTAVDRAWKLTNDRKQDRLNRSRSEHYTFERVDYEHPPESIDEIPNTNPMNHDDNENDPEWMDVEVTGSSDSGRKRRNQVAEGYSDNCKELPKNYRHIRESIRKVRPEFYTAIDRMISELHMSKKQALGATIIVVKELFNITWKTADEDEEIIDLDTAPDNVCFRKEGKAREILALSVIIDKIMECNEKSTITYHDDGSRKQGVGAFSVQGITIEKHFYNFPTVTIASERRQNLADLKILVLDLLSTASGVPKKTLWEKIDFTMTDAATHNLEVDDKVSEILETEHIPGHLLCQVHPACMFTRKIQELCKEIDTVIGPEKIFSTFAVSLSEVQDCVTEQWMDCLTRLVTHDFDQKSWNYADEFDIFIRPLKNLAKRLQKERFNSFVYTAAVVLWLDKHVSSFLNRFTNITNKLACIVRSFETLDYIRVLSAVIVIMGVHLVEPFLSLTMSANTTWENLRETFPMLYDDLTSTEPEKLLDLTVPAFTFISKERFASTTYESILLEPTKNIIDEFKPEVIAMIKLILPKLAEGWLKQRGEIFDFGDGEGTENNLKIINFNQEKLKGAPINNLSSERAVGSVNYGLKIYGNKQLNIVSSSLVKASASHLLEGKTPTAKMRKLVSKDGEVPQILERWEEKQKELRKQGMDEKDILNIAVDKQKNADLTMLLSLGGPFTKPEDVDVYLNKTDVSDKDKNSRFYLEVRYAKNTSVSFPKCSDVFRLKKNYKNLTTNEYSMNLKTYLNKVTCYVNMNYDDFKTALAKLQRPST